MAEAGEIFLVFFEPKVRAATLKRAAYAPLATAPELSSLRIDAGSGQGFGRTGRRRRCKGLGDIHDPIDHLRAKCALQLRLIETYSEETVMEGAMANANLAVDNGVKVEALIAAREALTNAPQAAQFRWRAECEWKNGTHSHSTVEGFFGLGEEQRRKTTFKFDADHPEVFASEDKGATPVEYVLVGLASCLTAGIAAIAQHRNIQLRSVAATIEGNMDLQGILGIDSDVRNGFGGIHVTYKIDADAKREEIEALVAQSQKRSAVYDIVTNPTNVTVEVR